MNPRDLSAELSKGKFRPAYYFFGSEDFRIIEAEKYVARQFLPDKQLAVNFRRLDGRKTSCADLLAELSVYPMLGEKQVISVSDFQSYKPTEQDRIIKLLTPTDPNRIIIFFTPSTRTPKKNSAFFKKISQVAETIEFQRLTREETSRVVHAKLSKGGLTIDPDARDLLVDLLAGNRGAAEVELAKLLDFREPGGNISADDVRKIAAGYQVYDIFELAEDIVSGDRAKVLRSIDSLLAAGQSPTGLLFFVGQHFVALYLVKGGKPLDARRRWLTRRFQSQAAKYSLEELARMVLAVADCDSKLRRSPMSQKIELERMTLQLMAIRGN